MKQNTAQIYMCFLVQYGLMALRTHDGMVVIKRFGHGVEVRCRRK